MSSKPRIKIKSFKGHVSPEELHSILTYIEQYEPDDDNLDNKWAQNRSGEIVKALGMAYSFSRCIHVLNRMIRFCDKLMSIRNDVAPSPVGGHLVWTGSIDAVWPNEVSSTEAVRTGGEQGDAVGHLGHCARLILEEEDIWEMDVGIGDDGNTYKQTAEKYVDEAEKTMKHILGRLLHLKDGGKMYFAEDSPYKGGEAVPWNQIMMFNYALQHLAAAHSILGNTDKSERYKSLVETNIRWFLDDGVELFINNEGHECYTWKYQYGRHTRKAEDANHANLDIEGLYRAYVDGLGVGREEMVRLANTFVDQMILGDGMYAGRVDGTSDDGHKSKLSGVIRPGFLLLAEFREDALHRILSADIKEGRPTTRFKEAVRIMWLKERLMGKDERSEEGNEVKKCHQNAKICVCKLYGEKIE